MGWEMRALVPRLTAYVLCAFVMLASCTRKAPPAETAAVSPPVSTEEEAPKPSQEAEASERPDAERAAAECRDDRQCREYLRCRDGSCVVPPAVEGDVIEDMPRVRFTDADGEELGAFHVELAVEPHERTRGLMYRRKMHPDFGMLFIFEGDEPRSFWMKNTYIPLDMVHVNSRGEVVGVVANAEPMTTTPRAVDEPARYVLELNAGTAAKRGIEAGARMHVENVDEDLRPE